MGILEDILVGGELRTVDDLFGHCEELGMTKTCWAQT